MLTKQSQKTIETIAAIRKYEDMCLITFNSVTEAKSIHESLESPRSSCFDGMPKARDPHAGEVHLAETLDKIAEIDKRYQNALTFLLWFQPMWCALTDSERQMLKTYKYSDINSGLVGEGAEELHYSTRQLHRMRQKALSHLEFLLYGE